MKYSSKCVDKFEMYIIFMNIRGLKKCMFETLGVLSWTWNFSSIFTSLMNAFGGISTWKIWFWPIPTIFLGKNDQNSPNFKEKNSKLIDFHEKF